MQNFPAYVFDIDGTLADSNCVITPEMQTTLLNFMEGKKVYFCSGSAIDKITNQITPKVRAQSSAMLPCMGSECWIGDKIEYQNLFNWPQGFKKALELELANSEYPIEDRAGDHMQDRKTMACFSTVGKSASPQQRAHYEKFETEANEREGIANRLRKQFPDLSIAIGGKTSMDISYQGNDKGQVLAWLRQQTTGDITFFGDMLQQGGNDKPLADKLTIENAEKGTNNTVIKVKNWQDTSEILKGWE